MSPFSWTLPVELVDLATVEEKLAVAVGVVVGRVALRVLGDVEADEVDLALANVAEGALQGRLAVAERLHLGAGQGEARLEAVEEVVLVPRAAVVGDQLGPCGHGLHWTKKIRRAGFAFVQLPGERSASA